MQPHSSIEKSSSSEHLDLPDNDKVTKGGGNHLSSRWDGVPEGGVVSPGVHGNFGQFLSWRTAAKNVFWGLVGTCFLGGIILFAFDFIDPPASSNIRCAEGQPPYEIVLACTRVVDRYYSEFFGLIERQPNPQTMNEADWYEVVSGLVLRSYAYAELGYFEEAQSDADRVRHLYPDINDDVQYSGAIYLATEDYQSSIEATENARGYTFFINRMDSDLILANGYYYLGRYQDAIAIADARLAEIAAHASRNTPEMKEIRGYLHQIIGYSKMRLDRDEEAAEAFTNAIELNRQDVPSRLGLVFIAAHNEEFSRAIRLAESIQRANHLMDARTGNQIQAQLTLAWLLVLAEEHATGGTRALALSELPNMDDYAPRIRDRYAFEALEITAIAYTRLGQVEEAMAAYTTLIENDENFADDLTDYLVRHGFIEVAPTDREGLMEVIEACLDEGCRPRRVEWCGYETPLPCRRLEERLPDLI